MSVRILLIGARICRNLGGPSLLVTTMKVLDRFFHDAEYTFISPTSEDLPFAETYSIRIIPQASPKRLALPAFLRAFLGISAGPRDVRQMLSSFAQADIIIDIWGICFSDLVGSNTFRVSAFQGFHFLLGKLFKKPVVKYTADLGPFKSKWNRFFAKLYLEHAVDLILARSNSTREELAELGVTTPVGICPDTAFLSASCTSELARDLRKQRIQAPIIGLSVSHMASRQSRDPEIYVRSMTELADYAVESTGAQIILIGNEFSSDKLLDDGHIAEEILENMMRKDKALIAPREHTAQQLKGIIRECDVVIAARYHSIIASLSQGIPVLAVSWHCKYSGVLGLFGLERYVCSVKSLTLEEDLKDRFDQLWRSRNYIAGAISSAIAQIREAIFEGGNQVSLLLASTRPRHYKETKRSL